MNIYEFISQEMHIGDNVDELLEWNDTLEVQLMSAEEERGRHSAFEPRESVLAGVGG